MTEKDQRVADEIDDISPEHLPFGPPQERERPLILLADDDMEMRTMLRAHFSRMDCDLMESMDGADTLEQIISHRPNLVVLDVMMPELTGWEICKYVKQRDTYQDTGVIMLTGIGPTNNELTSPLFGADDYLDKPFQFDDLQKKVRAVLASKGSPPLNPA